MKRVLLSTDFSENAQHAIGYALMLFGIYQVTYYLVNSYGLTHNIPETLISLEDILHEQSEKSLKHHLEQIINEHQDLNIESIAAHGDPPVAIRKTAQDRNIDIVVLGSQGSTYLNETMFGSTTIDLVNRIKQPMLIVPLRFEAKMPKRIVFATDLQQMEDLNELEPMIMLALKHQAEVVIMNVTGKTDHYEVQKALKRLDFNNHFEGVNYRFEVIYSQNVLSGITDFINKEQADLLVLSPKQYPSFKNLFHRSVTRKMIMRSDIPILVI